MLIRDTSGEVIGAVGVTGDTEDRDEELAIHGIHAAGLKTERGLRGHGAGSGPAENQLKTRQHENRTFRFTWSATGRWRSYWTNGNLQNVEAADQTGVYCLQIAEHHATPLNLVPVPGVYLGAVARATKRMRLGPLVYLLPLCSPLRLVEEICMLDHLSHGRLDVGVGAACRPTS